MGIRRLDVFKDIKGFTLIEILLIMSILSILLTIPVLNNKFVFNFIEKKEIKEFRDDICNARNKAIIESKLYSVSILVNSNSYAIYNYDPYKKLIKIKELNNLTIKRTTINNNEIVFGALGIPIETGSIFLTNKKGEEIEITVTPVTAKVNVYMD